MLSLLEKEVFGEQKIDQLFQMDRFFSSLDAYLSLLESTRQFGLVPPTLSKDGDWQVEGGVNLITKFEMERSGETFMPFSFALKKDTNLNFNLVSGDPNGKTTLV